MPLTLLEFSGKLNGNDALLNWITENELNTMEFIVERSTNGAQYNAVGKLGAANTVERINMNLQTRLLTPWV